MALTNIQPLDLTRVLRTIVLDWFVIAAGIFLSLKFIYLYPIFALIIAGRINALGIIAHDMSHQPLKDKSFFFFICEVLCCFPINTTAEAMAYHHLNHHRFSNTKKDPYFEARERTTFIQKFLFAIIRGFLLPFGWFTRPFFAVLAHQIPQLRSAYAKTFLRAMDNKNFETDTQVEICVKKDLVLLPFSTAMLIGAIINPYFIYFYFIPLIISGFFSICRLVGEHTNEEFEVHSKQSVLKSTNDHHLSIFDRILISPHSSGYHRVHHMFPTAPFYQLKELTEELKAEYETAPV